ncbi:unknown [Eggerthella sp. CAG:298]|nr:unknown [Eggerthella sp. CAG:298]
MKRFIIKTHALKGFIAQPVHEDVRIGKEIQKDGHAFFALEIEA